MLTRLLYGKDAGATKDELRKMTERSKLSRFLPWNVYDPKSQIYFNDDGTIGFLWECSPVAFAGEDLYTTLNGLFKAGVPFGSIVQFILYADDYIDDVLNDFQRLRVRKNPLLERSEREFVGFIKSGADGLKNLAGIPVRNYRLFVALKMPIPDALLKNGNYYDPDVLMREINFKDIQSHYTECLPQGQLQPRPLYPQGLINWMSRLLNDRTFDGTNTIPYDDSKMISDQIILSDTAIEDKNDHILIGNKIFRCITPKKFPATEVGVYPLQTNKLFGGYQGVIDDQNQIKTPYIYSLNIVFDKLTTGLRVKSSLVSAQKAAGNFIRGLNKKKNEFAEIADLVESGETFVRIVPSLWTWSDSEIKVRDSVNRIKRLWEDQGYTMQEDNWVLKMPLLISSLPFGLKNIENNITEMDRHFDTPADRVLPLLPVQADFAGIGDPVMLWVGRKGQRITFDFFNSKTNNYNGVIMAGSGGGKSYLMNNILANYYAIGTLLRVMDIGKSYQKQSKMFGARFIDFDEKSRISMNPFPVIRDIKDDLSVTSDIILQMVYSSTSSIPQADLPVRLPSLQNAILWAYEQEENNADIDLVYRYLSTFPDCAGSMADKNELARRAMENIGIDCHMMAHSMSKFTTIANGIYGNWFNNKSKFDKFDISSDEFVVLELDKLLVQKELFRVVVPQVMNATSQDLFLSKRDGRKRIGAFDEAAQYLKQEGIGNAYSPIISMVDAFYRRARKYNGSFWVILQSILDLLQLGALNTVIDSNTAYKMYLMSGDFEKARNAKLLDCSDSELEYMKSIKTVQGKYSELFISSQFGKGIARIIHDRFNYYVNTSTPKEIAAIESLVDKGLTHEEAIDEVIATA